MEIESPALLLAVVNYRDNDDFFRVNPIMDAKMLHKLCGGLALVELIVKRLVVEDVKRGVYVRLRSSQESACSIVDMLDMLPEEFTLEESIEALGSSTLDFYKPDLAAITSAYETRRRIKDDFSMVVSGDFIGEYAYEAVADFLSPTLPGRFLLREMSDALDDEGAVLIADTVWFGYAGNSQLEAIDRIRSRIGAMLGY